MTNPTMYESVPQDETTKEELTLASLNSRLESLAEAVQHMYHAFKMSIEQKFMFEDQKDKLREENTAQAFYNTSISITGLNSKIENLVKFAATQGLDVQSFNETSFQEAQAAIDEQDKMVREYYEKQQAEQDQQNKLTEAGE
ncbi:MAG: hypothetical protein PHY47_01240 [Lachnospiraceae bacterium]|nr:hypothetical protein [Lachnospiraceae bacterium]